MLVAACLLAVLVIPSAQATTGALDPTFGAGGKVTTTIAAGNDYAFALVLQPDGKLVAAGWSDNGSNSDFALARYNPDGTLDTSFNGTGKVTTAIGLSAQAYALALQPDGKLVAAGSSFNGSRSLFALARYNPDGTLDTSFNGTGTVTTALGIGAGANALALQPDGKLVAAGSGSSGSETGFALARYNDDGTLDTSFNGTGTVATAIGVADDAAYALALQPDGKLVAAGGSFNGSQDVAALVRYDPSGTLDTSFNGTGKVTTLVRIGAEAHALALQPDGKLVAAGSSWNATESFFALIRYKSNGSLDTSFNGTGKVTTAIFSDNAVAYALALQPDGRLVAAGSSYSGPPDFALARYNPNGTLDTSFNGTGMVTTAIGSGDDVAHALALQPDGKLVAAGYTYNDPQYTDSDFALARYRRGLCVVPKVNGKTLRAAERAIRRALCSVGRVTRAFSATVKKGRVISQTPKPGKKLAAGSKVKLMVSKGKKA